MKNNLFYIITILFIIVFSTVKTSSQQVNTMYFMNNVPDRNKLNPAFQPLTDFYLGLPVIGYTQFGLMNNSISLKDVIYNQNNGTSILFLNQNGNKTKFFNLLKQTTLFQSNFQINLLDFGFRTGKSYWSFSLTEKVEGQVGIPKDLMKLLLFGTPNLDNNIYNFRNIGINMSAYTEAAFGYSKLLNEKWSVGGKLKFLYGTANVTSNIQNIDLKANTELLDLSGNGTINYSSPAVLNGNDFKSFNLEFPSSVNNWLKPSGLGAGIDIGVTYKPINNLTLSAAINDLGFLRWNKNVKNIGYKVNFRFKGVDSLNFNSNSDINHYTDSLFSLLKNSVKDSITSSKGYTSTTSAKLNLGAEYGFYDNKLSIGLLSRTMFYNSAPYEELTASVNGRPINWFNASLSYSVLNGRFSNIGAGIGLRSGFINWLLSADYIPLNYAPLPLDKVNSSLPTFTLPIPYNSKGINIAVGIKIVFDYKKDADKDGVADSKDKCPDTPPGIKVDKNGCPLDSDGDGVPDNLDKCPNTPEEAYSTIDKNGCPLDSDGDGVPDYLDKCPDTPKAAFGLVDITGCPIDSDGDGVPDYLDKCKDTPSGVKVDSIGCPLDTDHDGVPDYLDKCPDTPLSARGMVDKDGCPLKNDVDKVAVHLDKNPIVPKTAINNADRPAIKKEIKLLFKKALQGIQFESGRNIIKNYSFKILNQIAGVLIANPTYLIEIRGHTDNLGNPLSNQVLSKKRANAVLKYLKSKGVPENRMTANGYGDTLPVSSNTSPKGRSLNRRVEFMVSFEEITVH